VIDATVHDVVPDAVPLAPVARFVHTTVVTPTLSEALPPSATVETVIEYVGKDVGVVIVQIGAEESQPTVIVSTPVFPAASRARSVMTLFPAESTTPVTAQLVAPVAVPEAPVAEFVHVTLVTPTLSEAVPPRSIGEAAVEYVGEAVGVVIVQVGEVGS
jgi:hypothetical protein